VSTTTLDACARLLGAKFVYETVWWTPPNAVNAVMLCGNDLASEVLNQLATLELWPSLRAVSNGSRGLDWEAELLDNSLPLIYADTWTDAILQLGAAVQVQREKA